jgi:N4-gp56 family major capsid protein
MAVGLRGGTQQTAEDRTFYVREMIQRAKVNLVWGNYGRKDFIPANGGLTAQWRLHKRISPSTTALVEGTYNAEVAITVIAVNASVAQYGQFYRQTEVIAAQAIDDIRAEGAAALGQAMGESYETLVRNVAVGGTTAQYAGAGGSRGDLTSGMRLTAAELREARTTLVKNAAPGPYVVIIEPDQEYDLWSDSNFSNAVKDAGVRGDSNPLFTGKLPNYLGMDIQVSNVLLTVAGGKSLGLSGADAYYAVAFSRDNFFGSIDLSALPKQEIYHEPGSGGSTTDPLNQTWSQGYKFAYAGAILEQTFGVRIETTSSLGAKG